MKRMLPIIALMALALATAVVAAPSNVSDSEATTAIIGSMAGDSAGTVNAIAGNVTQLDVAETTETAFWHGFFGDATVAISLTDGTNSFYSWSNAAPGGELYFATVAVANWGNVDEANAANVVTEQQSGLADDQSTENLSSTYADGAHVAFDVGANSIASPSPSVTLGNFKAVFLWDTTGGNGVYAALINNSATGYDAGAHDYEIILPTDGSSSQAYYVYAELI